MADKLDPACIFCKIVTGDIPAKVVRETERTIAFHDINPQAPVHVLVVPKDHYPNAATMAAADGDLAAAVLTEAAGVAADLGIAESGYRLIFNTGAGAGQTVFHAHVHVLGGMAFHEGMV
jgi:histidine triad (HIT) family protein